MINHQNNNKNIWIVCGMAFSASCFAFVISTVLMVPVVGSLLQSINVPEVVSGFIVICILFGSPIAGAIFGVGISSKMISTEEL
jgi:hypothetical protein